jgi:hypothetical protein
MCAEVPNDMTYLSGMTPHFSAGCQEHRTAVLDCEAGTVRQTYFSLQQQTMGRDNSGALTMCSVCRHYQAPV